jgi:hypothetical protein
MSNLINNSEIINLIKEQLAPGISDADLTFCLYVSEQSNLNPIMDEIYYVKRKAKIDGKFVENHKPMVSRKGARKVARAKAQALGQTFIPPSTSSQLKEVIVLNGNKFEKQQTLVGRAELVVDGQVVYKEADFETYKQTFKDNYTQEVKLTKFWRDMPTVMIEKVAEFQLLDALYGLDGLESVDAGYKVQPDEVVKKDSNMLKSALDLLGVNMHVEEGNAKITGNTFGKEGTLKDLGFSKNHNTWECPVQTAPDTQKSEKIAEIVKLNSLDELFAYADTQNLEIDERDKNGKTWLGIKPLSSEHKATLKFSGFTEGKNEWFIKEVGAENVL